MALSPKVSTVSKEMTSLLSSDSPYMKQAETRGKQQGNSRGLLNSSMGVGAVENSRISAAMPIAQADAAAKNQVAMKAYDHAQRKETMQLDNELQQSNMNLSNSLQKGVMSYGNELDKDKQTHSTGLQKDLASFNTDQSIRQMGYEASANTQGKYLEALDKITNNTMVSINEIETAQGIPQSEKNKMIENTVKRRDADLAWTRQLYSNMPTWDFNWFKASSSPSAPGKA